MSLGGEPKPNSGHLRCCLPDCSGPVPLWSQVPVCVPCGVKIAMVHMHDARHADAYQAEVVRRDEEQRERRRNGMTETAVVYYIDFGSHIKIGFTSSIRSRLRSLRRPASALLALEPGGRELENQRHRQFVGDRIDRREEFHKSAALLEHIETLRSLHPLPAWVRKPDTRVITRRTA